MSRTRTSRTQALETALVIYWTDEHRKTWYHVNEPLLLRRLAEPDDRGAQIGAIPENQEYMSKPENRLYMSKPENRLYMSKPENQLYMITPDSAITCTENIQKEGADKVHLDQELLDALARLGVANPRELVARYPDSAIRHWVNYCDLPLGWTARCPTWPVGWRYSSSSPRRVAASPRCQQPHAAPPNLKVSHFNLTS